MNTVNPETTIFQRSFVKKFRFQEWSSLHSKIITKQPGEKNTALGELFPQYNSASRPCVTLHWHFEKTMFFAELW
jgi:hypothetical protein